MATKEGQFLEAWAMLEKTGELVKKPKAEVGSYIKYQGGSSSRLLKAGQLYRILAVFAGSYIVVGENGHSTIARRKYFKL